VLQLLLGRSEIVGARVRLLAPTGKARVRLGKDTGYLGHAQTVAQLLLGDRFDPDTGRYFTNPRAPKIEATTCIVDESSMLTEDMLAAVVDAIPENCRLILVGDPNQLPPIGTGCPFVDIIEYLKREHDGAGVGELNTPRRQSGDTDHRRLPLRRPACRAVLRARTAARRGRDRRRRDRGDSASDRLYRPLTFELASETLPTDDDRKCRRSSRSACDRATAVEFTVRDLSWSEHAPHDGAQRRRGGSSGSSWCRGACGPAIVSYGGGAKCRPVFEAP
jgi:hypothetical protein